MKKLTALIQQSHNIILSTHRQCDGDGLGAQLAMFHALKKINKNVRVINVDSTPKKYRFLQPDKHIQYFESNPQVNCQADLCLIFDTNDERLLQPLCSELKKSCKEIAFIDHHPLLKQGPQPTAHSIVDTSAASTGEMTYNLIQELNIQMDADIALCLYTSITFDTQLYRYIRSSANSHRIAAELLNYKINTEEVHRHLFGNQTVQKMAFLAKALSKIEYYADGKLALLKLQDQDMVEHQLEMDESRDVIDMLMNIETLEAAVLFREDSDKSLKVSFRSKGKIEVLSTAENIGGGGHTHAAGAYIKGDYESFKTKIVKELTEKLKSL